MEQTNTCLSNSHCFGPKEADRTTGAAVQCIKFESHRTCFKETLEASQLPTLTFLRVWNYVVWKRCVYVEVVNDPSLWVFIKQYRRFTVDEAFRNILFLAYDLDQLHRRGIVHGGILASNTKVTSRGELRLPLPRVSPGPRHINDAAYLAPEDAQPNCLLGPQVDMFSLNALFYTMLTTKAPVDAPSLGEFGLVQEGAVFPPSTWAGSICRALDRLILQGLSKDPAKRPTNMKQFVEKLYPFVPIGLRGLAERVLQP